LSDSPAGRSADGLHWSLKSFGALTLAELYAVLAARVAVFVVEQQCPYPELDGRDADALHLLAREGDHRIAAYARILPPGERFDAPSIGRVLTSADRRGSGLGWTLMRRAIEATEQRYPRREICVSAQRHLAGFYGELGFDIDSQPYDEDGIAHVDMRRPVREA